ncbi:MAG: type III-B CRISPR module RAMP protein Cmr6 [Rubrivivax sp.]|nr:type III-B CRISPR module RAMP protein Cmr6 [Rubrivivax sp.]
MPAAAAPAYLGRDFKDASPALRFGLLLPIWTTRQDQEQDVNKRAEAWSREGEEVRELRRRGMEHAITQLRARERRPLPGLWDKNDSGARAAWRATCTLSAHDRERMKGYASRQAALAAPLAAQGLLMALDAQTTAPFTTGLGNEHPLENGFAFLNPYGLPYLPGSGVKGVLRQAARELVGGEWGDARGWSEDAITHLFGLQSDDGDKTHQRGALMFWDVLPQLAGECLQVEVMTPHQSHYYQQRREPRSGDSTDPHDCGQPNPIYFLTVPPGSRFTFCVQCDLQSLRRLAPALAQDGRWRGLVQAAFEHAFAWLGFGAKTAVGYGAMVEDPQARRQREAARAAVEAQAAAAAEQARLQALGPEDRAWEEAKPVIEAFRREFQNAKAAGPYNPGGPFNQARQAFMKTALAWTEARSRADAAAVLEQSATKEWGRPSNKERWSELQKAIAQLKAAP